MELTPQIINKLSTSLRHGGKNDPSYGSRNANIEVIKELDRKSLSFDLKERQILIHTTENDEKIYIQYPGKESRTHKSNGQPRENSAIRPWDFRPKAFPSASKTPIDDLSFFDIAEILFETPKRTNTEHNKDLLRLLAIILYRMAFFLDHTQILKFDTVSQDINLQGKPETIGPEQPTTLSGYYKYSPPLKMLGEISKIYPQWGGLSLEAFLICFELLCWNEDCKYFYRERFVKKESAWINATGRINTALTFIKIIGCDLGLVRLSNILSGFSQGRGVSPASNEEILQICKGFINES